MSARPSKIFARVFLAGLAVTAALLTGCSSLKLMYSFADDLVEREVDRYVDLDREQEKLVDRNLDRYFEWHRRNMLPRYATFLRDVAAEHRAPASREALTRQWQRGRELWNDTVRGAIPLLAPVAATLSPDQVRQIQGRMAERADEIKTELAQPREKMLAQRVGKMQDGLERFIGDLTPEQQTMLSNQADELWGDGWTWFKNRQRREYALLGFLMNQPSTNEAASFLQGYLLDPHQYSEPGYKAYTQQWEVKFQNVLHALMTSLTPAQRQYFVNTLQGYAADFSDLAS